MGKELRRLGGHTGLARAVAFTRDGKPLASLADDYTARLWEVSSGKGWRRLTALRPAGDRLRWPGEPDVLPHDVQRRTPPPRPRPPARARDAAPFRPHPTPRTNLAAPSLPSPRRAGSANGGGEGIVREGAPGPGHHPNPSRGLPCPSQQRCW
jgi:hypothetical protein